MPHSPSLQGSLPTRDQSLEGAIAMAPIEAVDHDGLERKLKDIIQDLYQVMVQVSTYDEMGRPSRDVLQTELRTLSSSLQALHVTASNPLPEIPPELVDYVENGRNPDVYTREFVEAVRRANQVMAGKEKAFSRFRDVLAGEMERAMPELREDVGRVLEATGGAARREDGRNGTATAEEQNAKN